jgi:hypothetical protein
MTHVIESGKRLSRVEELINLENKLGLKSSFNFIAEAYQFPNTLFDIISGSGFEIGVHGLKHIGNLFRSF